MGGNQHHSTNPTFEVLKFWFGGGKPKAGRVYLAKSKATVGGGSRRPSSPPGGFAQGKHCPADAFPALLSEPRGRPGQLRALSAGLWPRKCLKTYFPLTAKSCGGTAGLRETTGVGTERRLLGEDCPDRGGAGGGTTVLLKAAMAAALPSAPPCQHSRWRCPPPLPAPKMAPAELCPHSSWPPAAGAMAAALPFPARSQDGGGGGDTPCGQRAVKPLPPPRLLQQ